MTEETAEAWCDGLARRRCVHPQLDEGRSRCKDDGHHNTGDDRQKQAQTQHQSKRPGRQARVGLPGIGRVRSIDLIFIRRSRRKPRPSRGTWRSRPGSRRGNLRFGVTNEDHMNHHGGRRSDGG